VDAATTARTRLIGIDSWLSRNRKPRRSPPRLPADPALLHDPAAQGSTRACPLYPGHYATSLPVHAPAAKPPGWHVLRRSAWPRRRRAGQLSRRVPTRLWDQDMGIHRLSLITTF